MANRQARSVPTQTFDAVGKTTSDLPGAPPSGAEAFTASIKAFEHLSGFLNTWADKAAAREGEEAGIAAALKDGEQVALRKDGTLAGEAYDAAVVDTRAAALDTAMRNDIFAVAEQFKGNPEGMAAKLEELKGAYGDKAGLSPALMRHFNKRFDDLRFPYEKGAIRERDGKVLAEASATYGTALDTAMRDASRAAYTLGADPDGDAKIAAESTRIKQMISVAKERGYITPAAAEKGYASVDTDLATQKISGTFDRLQGSEAKANFLDELEKNYSSGKALKNLDPGDFNKLMNTLTGNLRRETSLLDQQARLMKAGVESIRGRVLQGYGVTDEEWGELDGYAKKSNSPDLQASVRQAKSDVAMIDKWWSMTPRDLWTGIAAEKTRIGRDAKPEEVARVKDAENVYAAMTKEAKEDLLPLAERTGRIAPTALDPGILNGTPDLVQSAFAQRKAAAEQAAAGFGVEPQYFNRAERGAWAEVFNKGGAPAIAAATMFARQWDGATALKAIGEIAPKADVMAHAAAVSVAGGSNALVTDVARALAYRAMPGYEELKLKPTSVRAAMTDEFGGAFSAVPAAEGRASEAAQTAFDARAREQRLSPDIGGSSRKAFRRTLQESAGAVFEGDVQFGGVTTINGRKTLIPSDIRASRAEDVIGAVTDADLGGVNGPIGANGKPMRAYDLRSAKFVAVGPGKYRVAAGDPDGDRPQWFADREGKPWIFDLGALDATLRTRRPDLFRGASAPTATPGSAAEWMSLLSAGGAM